MPPEAALDAIRHNMMAEARALLDAQRGGASNRSHEMARADYEEALRRYFEARIANG